jgi:hypothetical protein
VDFRPNDNVRTCQKEVKEGIETLILELDEEEYLVENNYHVNYVHRARFFNYICTIHTCSLNT